MVQPPVISGGMPGSMLSEQSRAQVPTGLMALLSFHDFASVWQTFMNKGSSTVQVLSSQVGGQSFMFFE